MYNVHIVHVDEKSDLVSQPVIGLGTTIVHVQYWKTIIISLVMHDMIRKLSRGSTDLPQHQSQTYMNHSS